MTAGRDGATVKARAARDIALWVGAVAGVVCIVCAIAALALGVTPLIFRSGSMQPAIGTGALALARTVPAAELRPGDVVCVETETGQRITHRVVAVDATSADAATLRLKGDANSEEDVAAYTVASADRVFFHVEKLGYVVTWLSSPAAVFGGGIVVGFLLAVAFRPGSRGRPKARGLAAPMVVLVSLTMASGALHIPRTQAAFVDAATGTTGVFASRTAFVPRIGQAFSGGAYVTCKEQTLSGPDRVTLTWRHLGAPYTYRIVLRDNDGRIWRSWDAASVPANAGDTVTAVIDGAGMPSRSGIIWQYTAEIHTMLPAPPTSSGAVSTSWRGIGIMQKGIQNEDLGCSTRGEQNGSPAHVDPPASMTCVSQPPGTQPARATLTWPHLGSPHTYRLTVRNETNRNILAVRSVTTVPAQAGQNVTTDVTYANLDASLVSGSNAVAEVRAVNGTAESAAFVSRRLNTGGAAVSCGAAAASRVSPPEPSSSGAPSTTDSTDSTESADSTEPAEPTEPTEPADPTSTGESPAEPAPPSSAVDTTDAAPGEPSPSPSPDGASPDAVTTPPTPSSPPTATPAPVTVTGSSVSGYAVQRSVDGAVLIVDAAAEAARITGVAAGTRMHWLSGTDQLWILGDEVYYLDGASGWTRTTPAATLPDEIEALLG